MAIERVRSDGQIAEVVEMVWEFFDFMRLRYPDMLSEIDEYIEQQGVGAELSRFREFFNPPAGECFLGRLASEPAGCVMLKPHGERDGEMNRMYVREAARGQGLGRLLGEAVVSEARVLGYRTLFLDALYRHLEALPLYESLGFASFTDRDVFRGDDERIIHMKMEL